MAATLKRDAQRLAATARGETAHREEKPAEVEVVVEEAPAPTDAFDRGPLAQVYAFQELVLNRAAECARCEAVIGRGTRAYLGLTGESDAARIWVCADCLDTLSGHD
jgi:hypothetical protein